ncbi:hypothetical protein BG011_006269 [Mortierella polycephala]|uniref:Uncharacterized protein n=1 Tax=Mortierella polycephala TaxID=41804 RepID=A0A9P6QDH6_9FUNG|nr:hypothetical protein BG011_006269 [Mortierella polycephala]
MLQSISAPIPIPGTQQEPTVPFLGSTSGLATTLGPLSLTGLSSNSIYDINHYSGDSGITSIHYYTLNTHQPSHHNNNNNKNSVIKRSISSLRRFPSISNTKRLNAENLTLRNKITELERYLTGLKEELILSHRQIHAKTQEAKLSEERKAVEIHELGQHIQRCESDLLAKTAECEALQSKLQYQTREQVSKLRQIDMLESEIMDFRRMSNISNRHSCIGGGGGGNGNGGGPVAFGAFRFSRISSDMSESVRSSTLMQDCTVSEDAQAQIRQLKDENVRKDKQIQELMERIETLSALASPQAGVAQNNTHARDVSASDSNTGFSTVSALGYSSAGSTVASSVNSVGYDLSFEHPKLIARYQALRMQHALASECLDTLDSENHDLRSQTLSVGTSGNTIPFDTGMHVVPRMTSSSSTGINVLCHPAASGLPSLDMNPKVPSVASPSSPTSTTTASSFSPTTVVAPTLTRKSSLRYSKDGQPVLSTYPL